MGWTLVGIDCATQEEHLGLALGALDDQGKLTVERVTLGTAGESAEATVAAWFSGAPRPLVAINAPLGWPVALGPALGEHAAGEPIPGTEPPTPSSGELAADALLRRETERVVLAHTGRTPTETTADRQTRRALAALAWLGRLRATCGTRLPLAWQPGVDSGVIEVRADATLRAHGMRVSAYRGRTPKARRMRETIVAALAEHMTIGVTPDLLTENADLLDALICVLSAADFARGECVLPSDDARAHREGWIWFRDDAQQRLF